MINADERKKLLAQLAELEKNSVNYFDVEKEFFLIDSDNLPQVRPRLNDFIDRQDIRSMDFDSDNLSRVRSRLYGYSIQQSGIYEDDNLTAEAIDGLDGRGCYVYVEVKDGQITIKQDLNGSWGIYLFRYGDYFALSNSFFRLVDHVKFKYPLTVNRDYCHHLIISVLVSHAYSETAVNEIQLVERNAIIHIDTTKKTLETKPINYQENTIPLDSEAGIARLDKWVDLWGSIFRGLAQHTKFISTDLSGGFDSRVTFLLLFHSGIDCSRIQFNSIRGNFHTYAEDYEIASQIATHYGLKLNQPLPKKKFLNYSLSDLLSLDLYQQQITKKYPSVSLKQKYLDKLYSVTGGAGEIIRGNWLRFNQSPKEFIKSQEERATSYSLSLNRELSHSTKVIFESAFQAISDKYKITDENSHYLVQYLYQETRCRNHFGKNMVGNYLRNIINLSPALDPGVRTLKLETPQCPDPKLLMALLFVRYDPDLLKFPFDSKRFIAPETIEYAKKINERFPRMQNNKTLPERFDINPHDSYVEHVINRGDNNKELPAEVPRSFLQAVFYSRKTHGLFSAYFDDDLYRVASKKHETRTFDKFSFIYPFLGIAKVLEDVQISNRNRPLYQDMKNFLESDSYDIPEEEAILNKFILYLKGKILIQALDKKNKEAIKIISITDRKAKVSKPNGAQNKGLCYMIDSCTGNIEIVTKIAEAGQIIIRLSGAFIPDKTEERKLIPYWIDYTKLKINDKTIFDTLTPAWCSKPYSHILNVNADEEIKIQVEWQPHRSDT
ncbi:MAG: hypothetical protein IKD73_08015 [Selenomonadaceae bacterium]|nr:hypothetical protein [Selenomonadaceae bacterium]